MNNEENKARSDEAKGYPELIRSKGSLLFTPGGSSMRPMLIHHETPIYVVAVENGNGMKKYDIPFYVRDNGQCVLHRIIGTRDGAFICCGDGQVVPEYGVRPDMIFAKLVGFYRGEKYIEVDKSQRYMIYSRLWVVIRPLRRVWTSIRARVRRGK